MFPFQPAPYFVVLRKLIPEGMVPLDANTYLIARDEVVIGWDNQGVIHPLFNLNGRTVVHYLRGHRTEIKSFDELRQMGVTRRLPNY